jgi:hypothetical protein
MDDPLDIPDPHQDDLVVGGLSSLLGSTHARGRIATATSQPRAVIIVVGRDERMELAAAEIVLRSFLERELHC